MKVLKTVLRLFAYHVVETLPRRHGWNSVHILLVAVSEFERLLHVHYVVVVVLLHRTVVVLAGAKVVALLSRWKMVGFIDAA